jgi:hypothetical protein
MEYTGKENTKAKTVLDDKIFERERNVRGILSCSQVSVTFSRLKQCDSGTRELCLKQMPLRHLCIILWKNKMHIIRELPITVADRSKA